MSDPSWPGTVPTSVAQEGYSRQQQSARVEFAPEFGPPIRRQRGTARLEILRCTTWLTATQKDAFWTFYQDTLGDGVLWFTRLHPESGSTVRCIFMEEPVESPNGAEYQIAYTLGIAA